MSRSVPLAKAIDDALSPLPERRAHASANGYPMRLLLPGWEGNMNVKWLRRIKLTDEPTMTKDETSKYTTCRTAKPAVHVPDGSEIGDHPSVAGLALEGAGPLRDFRPRLVGQWPHRQVEVSADGGQAGRRPRCRSPSCRKRSRASACRGTGTVARPCCKAAPPTTPAWCSRRARSSSRSAACAASITTTRSPAGASTRKGEASQCLRLNALALLRGADRASRRWRWPPKRRSSGSRSTPAELARLGHQHRPGRRRLAGRQRNRREGEAVYAAKCQACHGEKGAGKPNDALVGGMARWRPASAGEDGGQLLALRHHAVRLCAARDAVQRAEVADRRRRALRRVRLYPVSERRSSATNDVLDAQSLPKVKMPNRDGFIPFPRQPMR